MKNATRKKMGLGPVFRRDCFPSAAEYRTAGLDGAWACVTYNPAGPTGRRWMMSAPGVDKFYASRGAARAAARHHVAVARRLTPAGISAALAAEPVSFMCEP